MALDERTVDPDPIRQLRAWLDEARATEGRWVEAMTLATAGPDGKPSARAVMVRGVEDDALVFFSDARSVKGRQLQDSPYAAGVLLWPSLGRQVRVEGSVELVDAAITRESFAARPAEARLPVWVAQQSEVVSSRAQLEGALREARARFADGEVPMPDWWTGYRLVASAVEFWQEREDRLHDRVRYRREDLRWTVERLAP